MEWPPWLKIENIIGKLNLSTFFRYEGKKETNITNNHYNIQITVKSTEVVKVVASEIPLQKIAISEETEPELTDEEKVIIEGVNKIHRLNGSSYDFENSCRVAIQHIKNKASTDWFVSAAVHMANTIQSGGINLGIELFFDSFQTEEDPNKVSKFVGLKDKIKYCYGVLQNLRHVDKSGALKKRMIPEYQQVVDEKDEVNNDDYDKIFKDFQNLLIQLFTEYKIKKSL